MGYNGVHNRVVSYTRSLQGGNPLNLREKGQEETKKWKKPQPMYGGNSLIWILSVDFFSYNNGTVATPLLYLLLLQKAECHIRPSMLAMIKSPPRFLARPLVFKCLLKRTYVEEVRAEDKVPRFLPWCPTATEFQEQLGAVGGEHLWASFWDGVQRPPLRLPLLRLCHNILLFSAWSSRTGNYAWSVGYLSVLTPD